MCKTLAFTRPCTTAFPFHHSNDHVIWFHVQLERFCRIHCFVLRNQEFWPLVSSSWMLGYFVGRFRFQLQTKFAFCEIYFRLEERHKGSHATGLMFIPFPGMENDATDLTHEARLFNREHKLVSESCVACKCSMLSSISGSYDGSRRGGLHRDSPDVRRGLLRSSVPHTTAELQ